jgi:16S rRNA (cytosine1402-N4)-methyltransferase
VDSLNAYPGRGPEHVPVLLDEVLEALVPKAGGRYLDGTLGLGGHSAAILSRAAASGEVVPGEAASGDHAELCGLDRDASALAVARERLAAYNGVHVFHRRYSEFAGALDALGWDAVDGALLDIGVSSMQIDTAERGFSFHADGPLDMRMDRDGSEMPAKRLLADIRVDDLRRIIAVYGEDPLADRIAKAIAEARDRQPIETTGQLAAIVASAYPALWRARARSHPATRTFQALRMAVNDEIGELERFLDTILERLRPGGRVAVISFHSVEDRIVKRRMRRWTQGCVCDRQTARCVCGREPQARLLAAKPIRPGQTETARNPRSSSAKLRAAEKLPTRSPARSPARSPT